MNHRSSTSSIPFHQNRAEGFAVIVDIASLVFDPIDKEVSISANLHIAKDVTREVRWKVEEQSQWPAGGAIHWFLKGEAE
jgi:hypothetical protein